MHDAADQLAPPSARLKNPRPFTSGRLTREDRARIFNRGFLYKIADLALATDYEQHTALPAALLVKARANGA